MSVHKRLLIAPLLVLAICWPGPSFAQATSIERLGLFKDQIHGYGMDGSIFWELSIVTQENLAGQVGAGLFYYQIDNSTLVSRWLQCRIDPAAIALPTSPSVVASGSVNVSLRPAECDSVGGQWEEVVQVAIDVVPDGIYHSETRGQGKAVRGSDVFRYLEASYDWSASVSGSVGSANLQSTDADVERIRRTDMQQVR